MDLDLPSAHNFQFWLGSSSSIVHSMIKSVNACALITCRGENRISNSASSTPQFCIRLDLPKLVKMDRLSIFNTITK